MVQIKQTRTSYYEPICKPLPCNLIIIIPLAPLISVICLACKVRVSMHTDYEAYLYYGF